MHPKRREELGLWLNRNELLGSGAEVGSSMGDFARQILTQWQGTRLWLIDPWEKQDSAIYQESTNDTAPFHLWRASCETIAASDNRVALMPKLSHDAAPIFHDRELDFCYIDANHSYEAVLQDLTDWWPKIKDGGLLGGHDFLNKLDEGWCCRVSDAVTQWCRDRELTFTVTPCSSWWIRKP